MDAQQFLFLVQEYVSLRQETMTHQWQQIITVWLVTILMSGSLALSRRPGFHGAVVFTVVLGACAPFFMARSDLMMHDVGSAIAQIEAELQVHGWENYYKPQLVWRPRLLPILDFLAAVPIVFLFWFSNRQMGKLCGRAWSVAAWVVFLAGIGSIAFVMKVAGT